MSNKLLDPCASKGKLLRWYDYPVGIICYDSSTMKYQLMLVIHPLTSGCSQSAIPGCCGSGYTVLTRYWIQSTITRHVWISCKVNNINAYSPSSNPEFTLYISHVSTDTTTSVYNSFFSNYETTFQHVKPKFIILLLKHMPLKEVLGLWAWISL